MKRIEMKVVGKDMTFEDNEFHHNIGVEVEFSAPSRDAMTTMLDRFRIWFDAEHAYYDYENQSSLDNVSPPLIKRLSRLSQELEQLRIKLQSDTLIDALLLKPEATITISRESAIAERLCCAKQILDGALQMIKNEKEQKYEI